MSPIPPRMPAATSPGNGLVWLRHPQTAGGNVANERLCCLGHGSYPAGQSGQTMCFVEVAAWRFPHFRRPFRRKRGDPGKPIAATPGVWLLAP